MTIDQTLNDAFISLRCSLFQYVGENSPWIPSDDEAAAQATLQELITAQRRQIAKLAELMTSQKLAFIDQGTYPTEYTDLQYLSFSYLLDKIIADQQAVSNDLERAIEECGPGSEIGALLIQIRSDIATTIEALNKLANTSSAS